MNNLDPKIRTLLSVLAMVIIHPQPIDHEEYALTLLEEVEKTQQPWRMMDRDQRRIFEMLVVYCLSEKRRSLKDRREAEHKFSEERRRADRRWTLQAAPMI